MTAIDTDYTLTIPEIDRYHATGYLGPFTLYTPGEMAGIRDRIEREILTTPGPSPSNPLHSRYMTDRLIYDMIAHPAITERTAALLGSDLICWATNFWIKEPGGKEIPWHQDLNYWPIDPPLNVTAWIAIDRATTENSCVRLIPGSHKKVLPEVAMQGKWFDKGTDPSAVNEASAIDMVLEAGEFFLFSERLLHQSNVNRSGNRRMGMSSRMTAPFVKVYHDQPNFLFRGHRAIMIRGEDRIGINRYASPPPGDP